ncbi:MAG: hypothetical protein HY098_00115 [Nitrospinae bacterium]|nr:hypothetical protein [Nitrospinota bacterium]
MLFYWERLNGFTPGSNKAEFNPSSEAWVLQDEDGGEYVIIPHKSYPGRKTIHFFLRREDAVAILTEIIDVNLTLKDKNIFPVAVKLIQALRGIAEGKNPAHADSFVVHSPNEVYEFLRDNN